MAGAIRVAVVGGGISGLVGAFRLRQQLGADAQIDVFEAGSEVGGILHSRSVGGQQVDVGAEAFIVRRPEALALISELGLADQVVSPTSRRPAVWANGGLLPLPAPALMGIPAGPEVVAGLADPADLDRMVAEPDTALHWDPAADPTVGELVGERFGRSVVLRSVDPMLGGVYSSLADDIGVREALPALAARLDAGASSLTGAVNALISAGSGSGPVFGTLLGGYRVLVDALVTAAAIEPRYCSYVRDLAPTTDGWQLDSGAGPTSYDAVLLAIPAWLAGYAMRHALPDLATPLCAVRRASSVVLSMAFEPGTSLPEHSGVLVATGEALRAKAFTFSSQKWAHLGSPGGPISVRASFGRFGAEVPDDCIEPDVDERLLREALEDLDAVCSTAGVTPPSERLIDSYIQRWTNGLPLYSSGHLAAMRAVIAARPPRLAFAGSSYDGVGVPACIRQAGLAVDGLLADLAV